MTPPAQPPQQYIIHAVLGGCLGFLSVLIFWLFYFFQTFDQSVSDSVRYHIAFWDTVAILIVVVVSFYHKRIIALGREWLVADFDKED